MRIKNAMGTIRNIFLHWNFAFLRLGRPPPRSGWPCDADPANQAPKNKFLFQKIALICVFGHLKQRFCVKNALKKRIFVSNIWKKLSLKRHVWAFLIFFLCQELNKNTSKKVNLGLKPKKYSKNEKIFSDIPIED